MARQIPDADGHVVPRSGAFAFQLRDFQNLAVGYGIGREVPSASRRIDRADPVGHGWGVDRDSEIVAQVVDERNAAVKTMIASVIRTAKAKGRKIGICGQAPSDYPEFAEFLVEQGIDSLSLNPDAVMRTTVRILEAEKRLGNSGEQGV